MFLIKITLKVILLDRFYNKNTLAAKVDNNF